MEIVALAGHRLLWSEQYDRDATDVFAIQDDISHSIAGALEVRLASPRAGQSPNNAQSPTERLDSPVTSPVYRFLQFLQRLLPTIPLASSARSDFIVSPFQIDVND